jgi:hypothetical protein
LCDRGRGKLDRRAPRPSASARLWCRGKSKRQSVSGSASALRVSRKFDRCIVTSSSRPLRKRQWRRCGTCRTARAECSEGVEQGCQRVLFAGPPSQWRTATQGVHGVASCEFTSRASFFQADNLEAARVGNRFGRIECNVVGNRPPISSHIKSSPFSAAIFDSRATRVPCTQTPPNQPGWIAHHFHASSGAVRPSGDQRRRGLANRSSEIAAVPADAVTLCGRGRDGRAGGAALHCRIRNGRPQPLRSSTAYPRPEPPRHFRPSSRPIPLGHPAGHRLGCLPRCRM